MLRGKIRSFWVNSLIAVLTLTLAVSMVAGVLVGADAAIGIWNAGETQKKEEVKIAEAAAEWDAYMQKVKEQAEVQAQYEGNGSVPGYDPGCEDPELYGC